MQSQEQKTREETTKVNALREAAAAGFEAIERGEFREVSADEIGPTIATIGKRASQRQRRSAK